MGCKAKRSGVGRKCTPIVSNKLPISALVLIQDREDYCALY